MKIFSKIVRSKLLPRKNIFSKLLPQKIAQSKNTFQRFPKKYYSLSLKNFLYSRRELGELENQKFLIFRFTFLRFLRENFQT